MLEICLGYRGSGKFELRTKVIVGLSGNKGIRGNADADNPELWWQRGMQRCLSRRQTWFYLGSSLLPTRCGDDFFFFLPFSLFHLRTTFQCHVCHLCSQSLQKRKHMGRPHSMKTTMSPHFHIPDYDRLKSQLLPSKTPLTVT